jgi:hypothetical protein
MRITCRSSCLCLVLGSVTMPLGCDSQAIKSNGGSGGTGQAGDTGPNTSGGTGSGGQAGQGSGGQAGKGSGGATSTGGTTPMCFVDFPCSYAYRCTSAGYQPVSTNWDCHKICGPGPCSGATCELAGPEVVCPAGTRCVDYGSDDVSKICQPVDAGAPDAVPAGDVAVDLRVSAEVSTEVRATTPYTDACQAVANASFSSVSLLECGLTPTGTASCHWSLVFTDNGATRQVSYRLSDYMLTMSYQCSGFTVSAFASGVAEPRYTGTYDPATDILAWDKHDFTRDIR